MFKDYLKQYRDSITECDPNNGICFDGAVDPDRYMEKSLVFCSFSKKPTVTTMTVQRKQSRTIGRTI